MPIDTLPQTSLGSNVIVVTANSASSQNVNTINFVNTSTVSVSVVQGPASNSANIAFSSPGRVSMGTLLALGG